MEHIDNINNMENIKDNIYNLHLKDNDILYTIDNIDHIINKSRFNTILKEFISICNSENIAVLKKKDSSWNVMSKQFVLNNIADKKKQIIKRQINELDNIDTLTPLVAVTQYMKCMNVNYIIVNQLTALDHLIDLTNEVYDNNLLKLDKHTSCTADILYTNYVDFVKIKPQIKFVEKYSMLNE